MLQKNQFCVQNLKQASASPFYSTHANLQLSRPERDHADKIIKDAQKNACAGMISLGAAMEEALSP